MRASRPAFTLLEVILALALTAAVLALLTSTVAVQLRLYQAGRAAVEEAQLARALLRRMADELRGVVPDPAEGERVGTLVGTREELQFTMRRKRSNSRATSTAGAQPDDRQSDLRIVNYRAGTGQGLAGRGGLVRCERDYATTAWSVAQGKPEDWPSTARVVAPEVEAIEFTYCKEGSLHEQWDSSRKGRLPSAVKINVTFRRSHRKPNFLLDETAEEQKASAVYSLMVYLPGPGPASVPQDTPEPDTPAEPAESPEP